MNKREQQHFAAFFQQLYQTEQLLDYIKQQLANSPSHNPQRLFQLISHQQSHITIQHLRQFLEGRVACNDRELYEIFQRFDWSRQGRISLENFMSELQPFAGDAPQRANNNQAQVTAQTQGHFISLLVQILKRFRIVQVARKQIKYVQPYDAFAHLDPQKTGFITIPSLRQFFYSNDFNVTAKQLYYLLHALRRRCYRNVNLQVFCQNIDPLQFGYYIAYQHMVEEEREKQYLQRSRFEQQSMRRSRLQAQRIQHQLQKVQRKRQAELQRQLQLQQRVNIQIKQDQQLKQQQIRRAVLEQDRNIRLNIATNNQLIRQQHLRNVQDRYENGYLASLRDRQEEMNCALAQSALARQHEISRSRTLQLQYQQDQRLRQRQLQRQSAVAKEMEFSRQRIQEQSRRRYEDTNRRMEESRRRLEEESRRVDARNRQFLAEEGRRQNQYRLREEERARYEHQLRLRSQERLKYEAQSVRRLQENRARDQAYLRRLDQLNQAAYRPRFTDIVTPREPYYAGRDPIQSVRDTYSGVRDPYSNSGARDPHSAGKINHGSASGSKPAQGQTSKREQQASGRRREGEDYRTADKGKSGQSQKYESIGKRINFEETKHLQQTGVPK